MKRKRNELCRYIICGALTTFVNYLIYWILNPICHYLIANSVAWIAAVLFSFYGNRLYVFSSNGNAWKEAISFITMRFLTLLSENILLFLMIDGFRCHPLHSKIIVSLLTIIANYAICKQKIFHTKKEKYYESY